MKKYSCVIFDLDGTLADTIADIAASMNRALELHGFPRRPPEMYPGIVGYGIKKLAFDALPEETGTEEIAAAIAADAARFYAEKPLVHTRAYPGIPELIAELRGKKIKTAVISNKPDPVTRIVVHGLFPAGSFDLVQGERQGIARKPDPAAVWEILVQLDKTPRDTIFVGDSEVDMETARNASCFPLGVSWGFRPVSVLEEAGAALIVDSPGEISAFLD
ncbi:MAG: HAD family hydrolase [Treponema sp.]|jgi:phosphoglycolate phosphatase|nr:HAD family hydrolase [Treponema sp.]